MKVTLHVITYRSPSKRTPLKFQIGNLTPVLRFFNPPPPAVRKLFTLLPSSDWKSLLLLFHTWLLPTSTCSYFWSYYNWLDAVIIDFWRSWNNTLKKHVFTIILFYFFMCDGLSFINTMQKTLKIFQKKLFQFPAWMRKNFIPGNFSWRISAEYRIY